MKLTDAQCLALWERGARRHPLDRALLLAAIAASGVDWAERPLGMRDAALMGLRCDWFGPDFEAHASCPACHEPLAFTLDLRAFASRAPASEEPIRVGEALFRRPTSRDLAALAGGGAEPADVELAAQDLLGRLALDGARRWSSEERAAIDAALDEADPLAHVMLDLVCEQCAHRWPAPLDIAASLWDELTAAAGRIVDQVHALASAYGWSEADILAMPAARRGLYIERMGA